MTLSFEPNSDVVGTGAPFDLGFGGKRALRLPTGWACGSLDPPLQDPLEKLPEQLDLAHKRVERSESKGRPAFQRIAELFHHSCSWRKTAPARHGN